MHKPNVAKIVKDVRNAAVKHSPEILTGVGIAGMITTTVLAVKATPKALLHIEEKKDELDTDELTAVETIKATWKDYIPAVATGVFSTACLIGANSVNARRNAAFATAYKLSETALTEYREKVIETIGEKKEKQVREKVDKEHLDQNPVTQTNVIVTGGGTSRCYDHISGRYFDSSVERIRKAVNTLNNELFNGMGYASLNDFYDELGLPHTSVGDTMGWNVAYGLINIDFSSHIDDEGVPCIVLDYVSAPKYNFSSYR